jgi:hypothetical protein
MKLPGNARPSKLLAIILLSLFFVPALLANPYDVRKYEEDFSKHGYTKFSDFIAKLKADHRYDYVEDYLELYRFPLLYGEKDMLKNIANLRFGLTRKFRSPYQALCKIEDQKDYHKYRLMVFMHFNILIARNFLRIGAHYDKRHIHFHDIAYAKELAKSFELAKLFYQEALPYWKKARALAMQASRIKRDLDLGEIDNERYEISTGKLNLGRMSAIYLSRLEKKMKQIDRMLASLK